jgi:hypothetical protein
MRDPLPRGPLLLALVALAVIGAHVAYAAAVRGGPLGVPLPLFPPDNWWNADISQAPVDPQSASFIAFINNGGTRRLHPDFGPEYGIPYAVVEGDTQPRRAVEFYYGDESDGVDRVTGLSYPFYPIPDEAITEPYWIEGIEPGNQDPGGDRHMLIVDKDRNHLYELFDLHWDGARWTAGSGAFFDMSKNRRRPEGWTSADAAGLAVLPGLVRHDETYGSPDPIRHAFRVTVRATNGYVYPASHRAGSTPGALPMGARLRLKPGVDVTRLTTDVQLRKVFEAMKTYGLIVADNGSDMFITGTMDPGWDNDVLNPAFAALTANDFEVVRLGYHVQPPPTRVAWYLRNSHTGGVPDVALFYGESDDLRAVGDWDGDGVDTIGVFRPSHQAFYLRNSNTPGAPEVTVFYGSPGDLPAVADWDGDGADTIGIFRPSQGAFYLRSSNNPGAPDVTVFYGSSGDVPVAGDWDGDGVDTIGVFRPSHQAFYLRNSNTPGVPEVTVFYGSAGDLPLAGDWDGDGVDTIGVFRPSQGAFYLRNSNTSGVPDIAASYGWAGDVPVVGDWNGDGTSTIGVFRPIYWAAGGGVDRAVRRRGAADASAP